MSSSHAHNCDCETCDLNKEADIEALVIIQSSPEPEHVSARLHDKAEAKLHEAEIMRELAEEKREEAEEMEAAGLPGKADQLGIESDHLMRRSAEAAEVANEASVLAHAIDNQLRSAVAGGRLFNRYAFARQYY